MTRLAIPLVLLAVLAVAGCALPGEGRRCRSSRSLPSIDPGVVAVGHVRRVEEDEGSFWGVALVGPYGGSAGTGDREVTKHSVRIATERGDRTPARRAVFVGFRANGEPARRPLGWAGSSCEGFELLRRARPAAPSPPSQAAVRRPFVPLERIP